MNLGAPKYIRDQQQPECPFCKAELKIGASVCRSCRSIKIDVGFVRGKTPGELFLFLILTFIFCYLTFFSDVIPFIRGTAELELVTRLADGSNRALNGLNNLVVARFGVLVGTLFFYVLYLAHLYEIVRVLRYGAGDGVLWVRPKP